MPLRAYKVSRHVLLGPALRILIACVARKPRWNGDLRKQLRELVEYN